MSSRRLTVSSSSSTSSSGAEMRSGGRESGWSVVPMIQWPGHGMMNTTRPGIRSVIPPSAGSRSRRITMCEPRLGTNRSPPSIAANLASGSAAHTPVASMTRLGPDLELDAAHTSRVTAAPTMPLAVEQRPLGPDASRGHRAAGQRRPQHREREPGVVLDPVVVDDRAGQALAPQVGRPARARRPAEVAAKPPFRRAPSRSYRKMPLP